MIGHFSNLYKDDGLNTKIYCFVFPKILLVRVRFKKMNTYQINAHYQVPGVDAQTNVLMT